MKYSVKQRINSTLQAPRDALGIKMERENFKSVAIGANSFNTRREGSHGDADSSTGLSHIPETHFNYAFWNGCMLERLRSQLRRSAQSQEALHQWDKQHGLPASHARTMLKSKRTRSQLLAGLIL